MKINKSGINRSCTKKEYNDKFKSLGYEVVSEIEEETPIDLENYSKGGGWYEYEGKSYRKDDLLEVIE